MHWFLAKDRFAVKLLITPLSLRDPVIHYHKLKDRYNIEYKYVTFVLFVNLKLSLEGELVTGSHYYVRNW